MTYKETVLFDPSWGVYDMVIGKRISSAFAGPADPKSFENLDAVSESKTTKIQYSTEEKRLHQLYKIVKIQRIEKTVDIDLISKIFSETLTTYPSEWLLFLELYELVHLKDISLKNKIFEHLIKLKQNTHFSKLIADGLELIIKN